MHQFVDSLGFDSDSRMGIFLFCAAFTFAVVTVLWVIGLFQRSHSMMDGWYGFAYAVPAWFAYYLSDARSPVAAVLLLMVTLHGGRLGFYLAARWRRYSKTYSGDPRYLKFVDQFSPGYWWKSFFRVMEPQAVLIVIVGSLAVGASWRTTRPPTGSGHSQPSASSSSGWGSISKASPTRSCRHSWQTAPSCRSRSDSSHRPIPAAGQPLRSTTRNSAPKSSAP